MGRSSKIFNNLLASILVLALVSFSTTTYAADGEALFKANCASCHKPLEDATGPALKDARKREPSPEWVYKWVNNTTTMVETDPYAKALKAKWGSVMTKFDLPKEDIKAILDYCDNYVAPVKVDAKGGGSAAPAEDSSLLFGILTLILAVIAFILLQVNSSLRKLSDEKEGIVRSEPVPFYRNKVYLMTAILAFFCYGGYT
ncbi:MAG: hypothetical protein RLY16_2645, partial [Bacteroidota bacterium]